MKIRGSSFLFLALVIILSGCEREHQYPGITAKIAKHSSCKLFKAIQTDSNAGNDVSCIIYRFVPDSSTLMLKHVNAGFNCCPGTLSCTVSRQDSIITIRESEESSLCDCNCLFDLDIVLTGIETGDYFIKIVEPYCGNQEPLHFSIHISATPEGEYCVKRSRYPWGV